MMAQEDEGNEGDTELSVRKRSATEAASPDQGVAGFEDTHVGRRTRNGSPASEATSVSRRRKSDDFEATEIRPMGRRLARELKAEVSRRAASVPSAGDLQQIYRPRARPETDAPRTQPTLQPSMIQVDNDAVVAQKRRRARTHLLVGAAVVLGICIAAVFGIIVLLDAGYPS